MREWDRNKGRLLWSWMYARTIKISFLSANSLGSNKTACLSSLQIFPWSANTEGKLTIVWPAFPLKRLAPHILLFLFFFFSVFLTSCFELSSSFCTKLNRITTKLLYSIHQRLCAGLPPSWPRIECVRNKSLSILHYDEHYRKVRRDFNLPDTTREISLSCNRCLL